MYSFTRYVAFHIALALVNSVIEYISYLSEF